MGPNIGIWGTTEFVWSSRLWIYDQIRSGDLPAGIRDPNLRVAPTFDNGVTPISNVKGQNVASILKILPPDQSDKGETEFDHFQTLSIHKCTMCDFPNFSARSNNSWFSSISGVFSALGAHGKVVDTVLESSTREDEVHDVRFPEFFSKVQ